MAGAGLWGVWLRYLAVLQELLIECSLLHVDDEHQSGRGWNGERPGAKLYRRFHGRVGGAADGSAWHRICLLELEWRCKWQLQPDVPTTSARVTSLAIACPLTTNVIDQPISLIRRNKGISKMCSPALSARNVRFPVLAFRDLHRWSESSIAKP